MAAWVIGYGLVQSVAPSVLRWFGTTDEVSAAPVWALALAGVSAAIAIGTGVEAARSLAVIGGLGLFGVVFAVNSSLHSYLILAFAGDDEVSMDVGFYYSANAAGRLVGTLLSGLLFLWGGLGLAMWGSTVFVAIAWSLTGRLGES